MGAERLRRAWASDRLRGIGLTLYYLAIIAGLVAIHGNGHFRPPPFVYQEF